MRRVGWKGVVLTGVALALAVWWHRQRTRRKSSRRHLTAEERHLAQALPDTGLAKDNSVSTRKVELGVVENGILRISRERKGAMKVMVVLKMLSEKELDRKSFQRALEYMQERHPVLRCLVRESSSKNKYYLEEQVDASVRDAIPVHWVKRERGEESHLKVWQQECRKPPPVGANPVAFHVLEEQGVTEIVFVMDHFFCDGLSVTSLLKETMTLVAALEDAKQSGGQVDERALVGGPLKWQVPMEKAIASSFANPISQWAQVIGYIFTHLAFEPKMIDFPINDPSITAAQMPEKCFCNPYRISIPKPIVKQLLRKCKENKLTMGTVVAASTLYAVRDIVAATPDAPKLKDRDLAVPFALDMRRRYAESIGQEHLSYHISSNKAYKYNFDKACKEGPVTEKMLIKRAKAMSAWYQKFDYAGLTFGTLLGPFFEQPPTFDHMVSSCLRLFWFGVNFPFFD